MSRVLLALPPLHSLSLDSACEYARLDRNGQVSATGQCTLAQLGQGAKTPALECFLHPQDSLLASIELPPLSASRLKLAVACAADALILGQPQQMHVAHSPREASGQVHLAWLATSSLQALGGLLAEARLKLRGLYPAPYVLPVPPPGQVSACVWEGHLLLRHNLGQAAVQPLLGQPLETLLNDGLGWSWIGDGAPPSVDQALPAQQRWSGARPAWGLHGGVAQAPQSAPGWGRALVCCALALAVWTLGLNLYAAREAAEGQQLKAHMSQRVKQAFPELPVILNPLQQARQQLEARQSGAQADPQDAFAALVQQAGAALPFMVGNVQRLDYDQGQLHLTLLADAANAPADATWQAALAQAGVDASREANNWTLRLAAEAPASDTDTRPEDDDE